MNTVFEVYRYEHADGSAKEWAISRRSEGGKIIVRWGKEDRLAQEKKFSTGNIFSQAKSVRVNEKLNKGYRYKGEFCIDNQGRLNPVPATPKPINKPQPAPKAKPRPEIVNLVELNKIDTQVENCFF